MYMINDTSKDHWRMRSINKKGIKKLNWGGGAGCGEQVSQYTSLATLLT
jgi:hypothetical protein